MPPTVRATKPSTWGGGRSRPLSASQRCETPPLRLCLRAFAEAMAHACAMGLLCGAPDGVDR